MEDLLLQIVGRMYPLTIEEKDVEILKKAADSVNEKVAIFKKIGAYRDTQDLLAMSLLQFATENIKLSQNQQPVSESKNSEVTDKVSEIDKIISTYLDKNSAR